MKTKQCLVIYLCFLTQILHIFTNPCANALNCNDFVSQKLKTEIQSYQETANQIMQTVLSGPFKGKTYQEIQLFADHFGPRFPGTKTLENSIDWAFARFKQDNLENVTAEDVKILHWVRGEEKAVMITPRKKPLKIFGLGLGVATPPEGIYAKVIVVKTFDELNCRKDEVPGKIVVFNQDYDTDYRKTVSYRNRGPSIASKYGAVAALIRSITPFSINSPHTGQVYYDNDTSIKQIPCAVLTPEDASMLWRLDQSGRNITIELKLEAHFEVPMNSRNIIGHLKGTEKADKFVLSTCHIDSWDVGEGVLDDAGGCFLSLKMINLFKHLNLRPKRTLKVIWFTSEELSMTGARLWVEKHFSELGNINAIMESDHGLFKPNGLKYAGVEEGTCILKEILNLVKGLNATNIEQKDKLPWTTQLDVTPFSQADVPGIMLDAMSEKYMWFHHSEGDSLSIYKPDEVDQCLAVWSVVAYVVSDLSVDLPRK